MGHLLKEYLNKIQNEYLLILPLVLFLIIINGYTEVQLHLFNIGNPILSLLAMIMGTLLVLILSTILNYRFLSYIGKHSIEILVYHFLSFKIVTLLMIKLYNLNNAELSSFPVLYAYPYWWIIYSFTGILIPLLIGFLFRKLLKND